MRFFKYLYWCFSTKNRFVFFIFLTYLLTILTFSLFYQHLLNQDANNSNKQNPHFIINPDVTKAKIRQDSSLYIALINEDSLKESKTSQKIDSINKNLPTVLLNRIATYKNNGWHLKKEITQSFKTIRDTLKSKIIIPYSVSSNHTYYSDVKFNSFYVLPNGLTLVNLITLRRQGLMSSELSLHYQNKKLSMSFVSYRNNSIENENFMYNKNKMIVSRWINAYYGHIIRSQFDLLSNDVLVRGEDLTKLYSFQEEQLKTRRSISLNKRHLLLLKEPEWNYRDILYFTVISLFANNYSDIYPNDTITRQAILAEFVIVWFLTICCISIEPEKLFFIRKWKEKHTKCKQAS
ncbi:hypothetical protein [Fibrella forsythiae]|uniref:Uncharacterized protein n=1 Tax=Fibrella forsythiae TaxID=2817061 RepID=A0ABS3JEE8_9BACT|nr:hypothetical protein [Fibrella forsythiae]MBO0947237.1 hypothetical protein [Fibrella forsythiae]